MTVNSHNYGIMQNSQTYLTSLRIKNNQLQRTGEGYGPPLQQSCLENPMDGGAWQAAVHGVTESWTRLSDFTVTFQFHILEKEMATHSSVLPGESQGRGSLVGCRLWGHAESFMTEATQQQQQQQLQRNSIQLSISDRTIKRSSKVMVSLKYLSRRDGR